MSIRRLFFGLVIVAIFVLSFDFANDPDMWWHLKVGDYILDNGIPNTDPGYSFTAGDNEWFMHEWLSDVVMYVFYEVGGMLGVALAFIFINALVFLLMYLASPGYPYTSAFVVLWGTLAASFFMASRPQMFNLLLISWFVFVLEGYRTEKLSQKWLWSFVPLMLIWANLHSGFLAGVAILGVYGLGGILQLITSAEVVEKRDFTRDQIRHMVLVGISMVAVSLINPQLYRVWLYPFETTLFNEAMQTFIIEWQSPDFHQSLYWFFGTYFFMGIAALIYSKDKLTWTEFLLVFGTSMASFQSVRNIPIFIIVSIPVFSRHIIGATKDTLLYGLASGTTPDVPISKMMQRINLAVFAFAVIIALTWMGGKYAERDEAIEQLYPVDGLAFLQEQGLDSQHGLNHYGWGGYLIWHDVPVMIDGRADLYEDEFIVDYVLTVQGSDKWVEFLAENPIDYVFISPDSAFANVLTISPDWVSIYDDDFSSVFVPADSELASLFGG